jgi:hypothetical protein
LVNAVDLKPDFSLDFVQLETSDFRHSQSPLGYGLFEQLKVIPPEVN